MFEVKDGSRTLQFNGVKLGASSSWRQGSTRWIEFSIYKTENGAYILSRVGVSLVYHVASCPLVKRYGLQEGAPYDLSLNSTPCESCQPLLSAPVVFPEKLRYWAQVSDDPDAVLDALYKYDDGGARYLTKVAQRVLEEAADRDSEIDAVYRVEFIR